MKEIWADIENFEGWYQVSTKGRVRSVDRVVTFKNGRGTRFYKGKILKPKIHNGYLTVNLTKNKRSHTFYIHRLVVKAFKLHPIGKDWVNHKDGNKNNPDVTNLEYCTPSENNLHAYRIGLNKNNNITGLIQNIDSQKKRIGAYNIKTGKLIGIADCATDLVELLQNKNKFNHNEDVEVLARAIRYRARSGNVYKNMSFKYLVD